MTTEAKFKRALKEMMLSQPLSEINVTTLCDACKCHRQTFYYHYQDIYDLLAAIFLNEEVEGITRAGDPSSVLLCMLKYARANFVFLRSAYNSAASELVDDFVYSKITTRLLIVFTKNPKYELDLDVYRIIARRFAREVTDEFGYWFKKVSVTPSRFERLMKHYISGAVSVLLPAQIELAKQEVRR